MTAITLVSADPHQIRADAVVIGVTSASGRRGVGLAAGSASIDAALGAKLAATLAALGATGAASDVHRIPTFGAIKAPTLVAVGLGAAPARGRAFDPEVVRRAVGCAMRELSGTAKVAIAIEVDEALIGAVAEGALLGSYTFYRYRHASLAGHQPAVESVVLVTAAAGERSARAALRRAEIVCTAVNLARDLVNTPPSDLHPREFAETATAQAGEAGVAIEVLDEKALRKGGYGGIIGVGQGSINPPRLITLTYRHPKATRSLALIGKGITFDSGGLSLKPAASMDWMKSDMGGAAAVVAAITAIARLGLAVNVTGWAPMAENMPSGTAQRPSDVLTIYGGKTVEVLNTDAEGRLVLADALVRASEDAPDLMVDAATLTGAQLVALGTRTSAVMSNDDATRDKVTDAAGRAGEQMWPMPLPVELRKSLDSSIADIANLGETFGGMLSAGVFLKEFVGTRDGEQIPWAHLDIAGPAFNQGDPYGYTPKGGTGAAVRTFIQLATDMSNGVL
jgi:leucyl aminopeptidase